MDNYGIFCYKENTFLLFLEYFKMRIENNKIIKSNEIHNSSSTIDKSRRSFAKVGAVAPVIMTLASKSAFGAICSVSGYISATPAIASSQRHVVASCNGFSPGAWGTPYSGDGTWPGTPWTAGGPNEKLSPEGEGKRNNPLGTTMEAGFAYTGFHATRSMYDVLWMGGTDDPDQLGAHLVAALLNAVTGQYPPGGLTVDDVRDIYRQFSDTGGYNGQYQAAPGVFWNAATVVAFIQQTFH